MCYHLESDRQNKIALRKKVEILELSHLNNNSNLLNYECLSWY